MRRCFECNWWVQSEAEDNSYGVCRRFPPPGCVDDHDFASTSPGDWCAEFRVRAPEAVEYLQTAANNARAKCPHCGSEIIIAVTSPVA
jgi:hypothetical protein